MKKQKYNLELKKEAVKLVTEQGYSVSEAAASLGISAKNLYNWKNQLDKRSKKSPLTEEQIELNRLRKEVARLKLEREILKKAAAFFAIDQK